jgi:NAD(P)H dehydrogenase (quinone)
METRSKLILKVRREQKQLFTAEAQRTLRKRRESGDKLCETSAMLRASAVKLFGLMNLRFLLALVVLGLFLPPSIVLAQTTPPAEKIKILIVYHSRGGHTAAMAKAVAEGAKKHTLAEISVKPVGEVKCAELLATDALIVGSPVYWSNMAGEVKTFFDRFSTDCGVLPPTFQMRDKVGAAFVTGGETSSGKEIALMTIVAAMLGNRMIVVSEGQALGAAATTGDGKLPVTEKELEEARRLGERVAQVTTMLKHGKTK